MPPGHYTIRIDLETEIFSLTDESGKHKIFLTAISGDEGNGKSLLVFKHSAMYMRSRNSRAMPITGYSRLGCPCRRSKAATPCRASKSR